MDRMLFIAMTGAKQTMLSQAVASNNLANVNTTGFRADLARFMSLPVSGPGHASRVYAVTDRPGSDMQPGGIITTGNDLDVAVNGEGWIAVQAPDGTEAYTRAGELRISASGLLQTAAGHPVLGDGGPITLPPAEKIAIGTDGTVTVLPVGQAATTLAAADRIKLVSPPEKDLTKGEDGLMRTRDGLPQAADARVKLASGALETSNVNAVDAMVNLISLARNFELQIKLMKTAEENESAGTQVMRFG